LKKRKVALVTGGAVRLGKGIAMALAREGYHILLHYNHSKAAVEQCRQEVGTLGVGVRLLQADFSCPEGISSMWSSIPSGWKPDVLVNNASVFMDSDMKEAGTKSLEHHLDINFTVPYLLTKLFAKDKEGEGVIINILDTRINRQDENYLDYALSKKLLAEFTRVSAKILGPDIRVNGIAPGLILPPPGGNRSYLEERAQRIPLQRVGDVEAITQAVIFLISNHFITGQILYVDGGEHLL